MDARYPSFSMLFTRTVGFFQTRLCIFQISVTRYLWQLFNRPEYAVSLAPDSQRFNDVDSFTKVVVEATLVSYIPSIPWALTTQFNMALR
jgi:hypothetical protein